LKKRLLNGGEFQNYVIGRIVLKPQNHKTCDIITICPASIKAVIYPISHLSHCRFSFNTDDNSALFFDGLFFYFIFFVHKAPPGLFNFSDVVEYFGLFETAISAGVRPVTSRRKTGGEKSNHKTRKRRTASSMTAQISFLALILFRLFPPVLRLVVSFLFLIIPIFTSSIIFLYLIPPNPDPWFLTTFNQLVGWGWSGRATAQGGGVGWDAAN
jgi:hypothetical protein